MEGDGRDLGVAAVRHVAQPAVLIQQQCVVRRDRADTLPTTVDAVAGVGRVLPEVVARERRNRDAQRVAVVVAAGHTGQDAGDLHPAAGGEGNGGTEIVGSAAQRRGVVDRIDRDGGAVRGAGEGAGAAVDAGVGVAAGAAAALVPGAEGEAGVAAVIGGGHKTQFLGTRTGQRAVQQQRVVGGQRTVIDVVPAAAVVGGVLPGAVVVVDCSDRDRLHCAVGVTDRAVDNDRGDAVAGRGGVILVDRAQAWRRRSGQHGRAVGAGGLQVQHIDRTAVVAAVVVLVGADQQVEDAIAVQVAETGGGDAEPAVVVEGHGEAAGGG